MRQVDFARYLTLILEVYALQDQLRNDPPDDPQELLTLVGRIAALWNEAAKLLASGALTPEQLSELVESGHRINSQRSRDTASTEPTPFPYNDLLATQPQLSRLKAGDEIYGNDPSAPTQWIVWGGFGHKPSGVGWRLLETIP